MHSKVCSCHLREGLKSAGPELFERNAHKLFPSQGNPSHKKRKLNSKLNSPSPSGKMTIVAKGENISEQTTTTCKSISTEQIILMNLS